MVYLELALWLYQPGSEVDSTESLWYKLRIQNQAGGAVLKLTPPSHYGITPAHEYVGVG